MKKEKPKQEVNAVSDLKTFGFVGFNKKRSKEETEQLFGWQKKINQKPKKDFLVAVDKNCGTGSGGFQAGNTCATGTQPSVTDVASFGTRKTAPSESIQRISAIIDHLTKTPEAELRDEIEKIFTNCGFNDGEKRAFGGQDRTPLVMANYFMKAMEETIKDVENLPPDGAIINSDMIKNGTLGFIAGMALYSEINGESMLGFVSKDEQEQPFRYSFESSKNAPFIGVFSTRSPNEPFNSGWYAYISLNTFGIYKSMKIDDRFSGTSASAVQSEKIASGAEQTTHMSYLLAAMAQNPNTKNSAVEFDSTKLNGGIPMSLEKTAALFSAHVAIHEIAHAAHFSKLLKESKGQFAKADFKMKEMARSPITIGDKLSKNTNSSQTEFVADIFAGLALGATYSDDVYKKYKQLSAPTRKIPTDKNIRNKFNFIQNVLKNCGTGSGGFQAGNTCAGGGSDPASGTTITINDAGASKFPNRFNEFDSNPSYEIFGALESFSGRKLGLATDEDGHEIYLNPQSIKGFLQKEQEDISVDLALGKGDAWIALDRENGSAETKLYDSFKLQFGSNYEFMGERIATFEKSDPLTESEMESARADFRNGFEKGGEDWVQLKCKEAQVKIESEKLSAERAVTTAEWNGDNSLFRGMTVYPSDSNGIKLFDTVKVGETITNKTFVPTSTSLAIACQYAKINSSVLDKKTVIPLFSGDAKDLETSGTVTNGRTILLKIKSSRGMSLAVGLNRHEEQILREVVIKPKSFKVLSKTTLVRKGVQHKVILLDVEAVY